MKHSIIRSLHKLFSRITLSYCLIVATLFNSVAPAILGLTPSVHAAESAQINLSYIDTTSSFGLTVSPVSDKVAYGLYTKTSSKIDQAIGGGDVINNTYKDSILAGTQSGNDVVLEKVERGILKTKIGSNSVSTKYFVMDSTIVRIVAEMNVDSLELSTSEESWLTEPNTYGDLKTGATYHAPFNQDLSATFTSLPSNPGTVTFNKISLTPEQIKESGAVSADAYELTSSMADGTFTYTLTLPNPSKKTSVGVQYSEDGVSFDPTTNVTSNPSVVTIKDLNHFTIFVVTDDTATYTGTWIDYATQGYSEDGVHYPTTVLAGSTATWNFSTVNSGSYRVYVSWSTHSNRTTSAPYILYYNSGVANFVRNQELLADEITTGNSGQWSGWSYLGAYDLNNSSNLVLTGVNNASGTDYVIADEILLVPNVSPTTVWVDDDFTINAKNSGHIWGYDAFATIQEAITAVSDIGTINVAAGTYLEVGQIIINKNLTIIGADKTTTIIKPSYDMGGENYNATDSDAWFLVSGTSTTFNLSNVTLSGAGKVVREAIRHHGNGTLDNLIIKEIQNGTYYGTGIDIHSPGTVDVTNTDFSQIGRVGVVYKDAATSTLSGNTYVGKGIGNQLDYGFDIQYGAHVTINNNTISNNRGIASTDGSDSAAISVWDDTGTEANITNNTFTNNYIGVAVAIGGFGTSTDPKVIIGSGNNFNAGDIGVDLENLGTNGIPDVTFGASTFKGFGPESQAIKIADGIGENQIYDIRNVIFKDSTDVLITDSSIIENLVFHHLDLPTSNTRGTLQWDYVNPSLTITSPTQDQLLMGRTITIRGTANDENFNYYYCYVSNLNGHEYGTRDASCNTTWHSVSPVGLLGSVSLPSDLPDDKYVVHLIGKDKAGNTTEVTQTFILDNTAPTVPVLTWPISGVSTNDNTPLMQWNDSFDVLGVAGYLYHVYYHCSNPSLFSTCSQVYPSSVGLWLTASQYQAGTTSDGVYYWEVRAQDNAGNQSDWSDAEKITIDATAPLITVNSFITNDNTPRLTGTVNDNAASISVQIGSNTFAATNNSNGTWTLADNTITPSLVDGTYNVVVRATDLTGNIGTDTTTDELIIDTVAPTATYKHYIDGEEFTGPIAYVNNLSRLSFTGNYSDTNPSSQLLKDSYVIFDAQSDGSFKFSQNGARAYCSWRTEPNLVALSGNPYLLTDAEAFTNCISSLGEGGYYMTHQVYDNAVRKDIPSITQYRDVRGLHFVIDKTKPESTITVPAEMPSGSTKYMSSWDGSIAGTAVDDMSGIGRVDLSISRASDGKYWDGTNWVTGTESTTRITSTGTSSWTYGLTSPLGDSYTITSHAIDVAGNIENSYVLTVVLDKTIPEVSIALNPSTPDASNGWYKTQPEITLTATDTNIDFIEYQWDSESGNWTTYSSAFKPAAEGAHVLYYRAHDLANNYSEIGIKNIKWDQTELTSEPLNIRVSPNPTSGSTSVVTWEAASDNIGIDKYEIQWRLGDLVHTDSVGSDIRSYEITGLTEGQWSVLVRAYDAAGNSKEASTSLTVDRTSPSSPVLTLTGTTQGTANLSWNAVAGATSYVIWYGTSTGNYIFGANVGNVTSYSVQGLGAGNYYFIIRANDASGNGSSNSNEVVTGTIAGAPGVAPGAVAAGFSPEPAVLGEQTSTVENQSSSNTDTVGKVLGASTLSFFQNLIRQWWFWLILLIIVMYLIYRRIKKNKNSK